MPFIRNAMSPEGSALRASDALRVSESRYRRLFETARDGILLLNAETAQIEDVNPYLIEMLGYSHAEFLGRKLWEMGPFADVAQSKGMFAVLQTTGYVRYEDLPLKTKSGRNIAVEFVSNTYDCEGIRVIQCNVRDQTQRNQDQLVRKSLESQLRESQKMQAIGTLAGGIAHDFNNILATILGNAELARQDAEGNAAAAECLDEILKAGARGRNLVQQILAFSRRQPTELKSIDLTDVVLEAARLMRAAVPPRLRVEASCAPRLPKVMADATQIEQVVINLATNAMQAMREGNGSIGIKLDSLPPEAASAAMPPSMSGFQVRHTGAFLRLTVSDTGPGMDKGVQERIFEPFFTTKPAGEGTGLGLSVVHGIVRTHDGEIAVDSEPGKGTRFTVYLPACQTGSGEAASAAETHGDGAGPVPPVGGHVLYLDDDQFLVSMVRRFLERRGFRVSAFMDQMQAMAAVKSDPAMFDLVATDYNMPGRSGLDIAREVRSLRADLPVVVTSGFVDEALQAQARDAGVREVVFKADSMEAFCDVVTRLIAENGRRNPRS